jgi:hypothetical protein
MAQAGAGGAGASGGQPDGAAAPAAVVAGALVSPPSPALPTFDVEAALLGPLPSQTSIDFNIHPRIDEP